MNSLNLLKNILSLGGVQIVNYVFPFITIPYVSRIIGPDGYGIYNYAVAFTGYFVLIIAYGFDLTGTRKIAQNTSNNKYLNKIVSKILYARLLLFILATIIFSLFYQKFDSIQDHKLVSLILFLGCIANVFSPQYIYQGLGEMPRYAKLSLLKGFTSTILVFSLVNKQEDYITLSFITSGSLIFVNILSFWYALRKFNIYLMNVKLTDVIALLYKEKVIFFSTVVINLYTLTNTVVLGTFIDNTSLGYYTTAQNFLNIVMSVVSIPISLALYPFIGKAFSSSKEEGLRIVKIIFPIVFYVTLGVSIFLFLLSPLLINGFYGNKFNHSVEILQMLSFQPVIIAISNMCGIQIMLNLHLDKQFFRITLFSAILGFVINLYFSSQFGYWGTVISCIIVESFVSISMMLYLFHMKINIIDIDRFKLNNILNVIYSLKEKKL